MTKKGKGIKTGGKMKAAKPPILVTGNCQFCNDRAQLEITSPEKEGVMRVCFHHTGWFFAVWSGNAREFTAVKL